MAGVAMEERVAVRQRPQGWPVMHQAWDKLLFLHWPVETELLRPLIPPGLEIDMWEESGWVGVTPFAIGGIRPPLLPAVPLLSTSYELNVRTYVHRDGVPGVWFLSLDASNPFAVWGARLGFSLPYFRASMKMEADGGSVAFQSKRIHSGAAPASFDAKWQVDERRTRAQPGTFDFFLIERYCLYSSDAEGLYRARIHHEPWPLREAHLERLSSTMLESHGLPTPRPPPVVHAQADKLHVWVWPPQPV